MNGLVSPSPTNHPCLSLFSSFSVSPSLAPSFIPLSSPLSFRCPALILLDDLHTLCPHGDHTSEGERRAAAALAHCLDSLYTALPPRHVVVIATTNQIEAVSLALRRPGRFDKEVEVTVPTAQERREVSSCCHSDTPGILLLLVVKMKTYFVQTILSVA